MRRGLCVGRRRVIFLHIEVVVDATSIIRNESRDLGSFLSPDALTKRLKFKLGVVCGRCSYMFVGTLIADQWSFRILHQVTLTPYHFPLNSYAEYAIWRLLVKSLQMQLLLLPSLLRWFLVNL